MKDKTKLIAVRLSPLELAKLDALAKERGVNRSEMLRIILEDVVKAGSVNWDTGKVKLVTEEDILKEYVGHDTGREWYMEHICKICGKPRDIFQLEFRPDETDAGIAFSVPVCGTCWEIIAAISRRVIESMVATGNCWPVKKE